MEDQRWHAELGRRWWRRSSKSDGRCSRAGRLRVCACRGLRPGSYCARSGTRDIRRQLGGSLGPRACGVQPFTAVRWESGLGRAATQTRGRGIPLYRSSWKINDGGMPNASPGARRGRVAASRRCCSIIMSTTSAATTQWHCGCLSSRLTRTRQGQLPARRGLLDTL